MLQYYHQFTILLLAIWLGITSSISIIDDDNTPRKTLTPIVISKLIVSSIHTSPSSYLTVLLSLQLMGLLDHDSTHKIQVTAIAIQMER